MQRTHPHPAHLVALAYAILLGGVAVTSSSARADVFNTKIASVPDGSIVDWAISPGGGKVVYSAWENLSGGDPNMALFSVSAYGGSTTKLATLAAGCCNEWKIGPRGSKVFYLDRLPGGFVNENALFYVSIDGSTTGRVSSDGHHVFQFEITPNGERVILTSAPFDPSGYEINLYSAIIGGGGPQRLNIGAPLPEGGGIGRFAMSNFGGGNTEVVYLADQRFDEVVELFSVSAIPGSLPVRLNPDLVAGGDVHSFGVAPSGQHEQWVAYLADQDTDGVRELYSTLIITGGSYKLNGTPDPGLPVPVGFLGFDPSGSRVLYIMADAAGGGSLYSAPVMGGSQTKISGDFTRSKFFQSAITPGGRVIYNADDETPGKPEIFATGMSSGGPKRISHDIAASLGAGQLRVSPDGTRVLYATKENAWSPGLLWSVRADGIDPVQINSAGTALFSAKITPDSDTVVWMTANSPGTMDADVYMAPITGGTPVKLSHSLPGASSVGLFEINPSGSSVVYDAKEWDYTAGEYGPTELFMSTISPDDYDGDGMSNDDEGIAGTNPLDPDDVFRMEHRSSTGRVAVAFDSVTGRVYAMDRADDLLEGPGGWTEFTNGIPGTGGPLDIVLDSPTGATGGVFRLKVQLAP